MKLTKLASKPWITKGMLNSIKTENKLYKTAINNGTDVAFQKCKNLTTF